MNRELERRCSELVENYRILAPGYKMASTEMVLACAGVYQAAGVQPDMSKVEECKKILKSKAGAFSNFRGSDEPVILCKMALSDDPARYFENLEKVYKLIKTFFSGEQTVLAAMILAEQGASAEGLAEKTKQIYKEMREAHPWLTSEEDLPFAALMAVSGRDASAVYTEAEKNYNLLKESLRADHNTLQMLSHILAIRSGRAEEKCEKLCALAGGLKAAKRSLGSWSRLAILGILADSGLPTDALVDHICEADDYLKEHKPFHGIFGVGNDCRRMFAVEMVQASFSGEANSGVSAILTASIELAIITAISMMIIISSTAAVSH